MHKQQTSLLKAAQQGSVLLEAMIAILLFSMGVLAIVGLQAVMIKNTADSKYRADASYIAQERIGLMWANPPPPPPYFPPAPNYNLANYPYLEVNTDISALLPGGTRTTSLPVAGQPTFTVTITWQQPGAGEVQHQFTTTAQITGG